MQGDGFRDSEGRGHFGGKQGGRVQGRPAEERGDQTRDERLEDRYEATAAREGDDDRDWGDEDDTPLNEGDRQKEDFADETEVEDIFGDALSGRIREDSDRPGRSNAEDGEDNVEEVRSAPLSRCWTVGDADFPDDAACGWRWGVGIRRSLGALRGRGSVMSVGKLGGFGGIGGRWGSVLRLRGCAHFTTIHGLDLSVERGAGSVETL